MKSNIVDLELIWLFETENAVLVASDEQAGPVWLPKSMVEIEESEKVRGSLTCITMPEPIAVEKGLV